MVKKEIGASIICMDPLNLERDVRGALVLGVDYLHFDVMDGVRVPRYGLYPEQLRNVKEIFPDVCVDVHLMVADPLAAWCQFLPFLHAVDRVSFHYDGNEFNAELFLSYPLVSGLVLNLGTTYPSALIRGGRVKQVTLMGCHPGVLANAGDRTRDLTESSRIIYAFNRDVIIQVDGGVRWEALQPLARAGVDRFVCGSATLYSSPDLKGNYDRVRSLLNV